MATKLDNPLFQARLGWNNKVAFIIIKHGYIDVAYLAANSRKVYQAVTIVSRIYRILKFFLYIINGVLYPIFQLVKDINAKLTQIKYVSED